MFAGSAWAELAKCCYCTFAEVAELLCRFAQKGMLPRSVAEESRGIIEEDQGAFGAESHDVTAAPSVGIVDECIEQNHIGEGQVSLFRGIESRHPVARWICNGRSLGMPRDHRPPEEVSIGKEIVVNAGEDCGILCELVLEPGEGKGASGDGGDSVESEESIQVICGDFCLKMATNHLLVWFENGFVAISKEDSQRERETSIVEGDMGDFSGY